MLRPRTILALCAAAVFGACAEAADPIAPRLSSVSSDAYEIVELPQFGSGPMNAFLLNDAGLVAGRYSGGTFLWTRQHGFEDAGQVNGFSFMALGMNNQGDLAGWVPTTPIGVPGDFNAILRTRHGFQQLNANSHNGRAHGINERRQVSGVLFPRGGGPSRAFVWDASTGIVEIAPPAGLPASARTNASGINQRGQVTGSTSYRPADAPCCDIRPFLWDRDDGLRVLPGIGGQVAVGQAINGDGVIVGSGETRPPIPGELRPSLPTNSPGDVPIHAFRWSPQTGMQDLGTLGGQSSVAWDVDEQGNAYGWAHNAAGQARAVKWTVDGRIVELGTLSGLTSSTGDVNHRGVVGGQASTASGELRAVIFIPR